MVSRASTASSLAEAGAKALWASSFCPSVGWSSRAKGLVLARYWSSRVKASCSFASTWGCTLASLT